MGRHSRGLSAAEWILWGSVILGGLTLLVCGLKLFGQI